MKLTETQIVQFQEEGFLAAAGILSATDLAPVIAEYEAWIENRALELQAEGKITDLCIGEPFERRLAMLSAQSTEISKGMDIMEARGPAIFELLNNANLLNAVESLVGSEITCNPIQHIRAKPPGSVQSSGYFNVPWHQDSAVTWEEADNSNIVTCWFPLVDATVENGCMEVMPGVFRNGYIPHYSGDGGTTIRPDLLPTVTPVAVPINKGGIIFMHRCTPHRSTPNLTDTVRWSVDLRYQPTGQPTGRPFYPEFEVRSSRKRIVPDYDLWVKRWIEGLETGKGARWHRST